VRRVLYLSTTYQSPYAGTEGQIHALLTHLPPGYEAELWVHQEPCWPEALPFALRRLGLRRLRSPRTFLRLRGLAREVRTRDFALIHTFMADASFAGCLLGRLAGVPVLASRRDMGIWQTPGLLRAVRFANRYAAGFVANCEAVRQHTVRTERVPPAAVRVIENGLDPGRFAQPADPDLRRRLALPPGAPVMGLVGNYREIKRHADLVDALALLTGEVSNLHLVLVGLGLEPVMEHARRRGVESRVRALLHHGDVVPLLRHWDVGVLCSDSEGLSNAVLEYMGCGLPVVASRVGGNPELVADGENGLLVDAGDVHGLAAALARLFADPALRRAMGEASLDRFAGRYTLDRMVAQTTALYDELLAG